jgi:iron complex outermembrane recepter protein
MIFKPVKTVDNLTVKRILFFLSLLLMISPLVLAQNTGVITGIVTDNHGNPLPGAAVLLVGTNTGTSTDPDGRFELYVPAGDRTLQVSFIGYQTTRSTFRIQSGESLEIHLVLRTAIIGGDEVVILGSRRGDGRSVTRSPVPVDVITAQEVQATGLTQTTQIIRALVPSFNSPESSVTDGSDHVRPATLRGLGPDQTLILINGKRRHTSSILHINATVGRGATGVDLNAIPANMIERIEVLRDGAAAQYGSDAIAGVINIVLKESSGFDASFSYGQYATYQERGYAPNQALPALGVNSQTAAFQSLPYYPGVENVWRLDGKSINLHTGYGFELPNKGKLYVSAQYRDKGRTNRAGLDPRLNYPPLEDGSPDPREATFNRDNHRHGSSELLDVSGFFNGYMEVAENAQLYAFGGVSFREGTSGGFYRPARDNRNLPEFYPDGFLPLITTNIYDGSFSVGIKGSMGLWNYDLSQVYGHNSIDYGVTNSLNRSMGISSPTTFRAGTLAFDQATTNFDLVRTANIGTAQPLSIALGAEYRYELYRIFRGEAASYADGGMGGAPGSQVFPGYSPRNEQNENRFSAAVYVDLETDVVEQWTVALAGRFETYSDFGNTITGKFATRFEIMNGLALRGAASTGFRAPSLAQSYFTSIATTFREGIPFEVGTFPVNSPPAIALGAQPLEPETSVNFSAGVTFERRNFLLTADVYRISIEDRIVMTENFLGGGIPAFLEAQGINATGGRYFTNAVNSETNGIDIIARYGLNLTSQSTFVFTLGMNFNQTEITNKDDIQTPAALLGLTETPLFGRVEVGRFEVGQPRSTINFMTTYTTNKWNILARITQYGEIEALRRNEDNDQVFGAKILTDLEVSYNISDNVILAIGGNNIFDIYPDKTFQSESNNGIFQYYSFSPSGFDGRFLYSRIRLNI